MTFFMFYVSWESMKTYLTLLLPLMGSQIATSMASVLCLILIARSGSTESIAVFGLTTFFTSILCSPFVRTANEIGGIYFSTLFGAKKYEEISHYFYKTLFILFVIFIWLFVFSVYSTQLLTLIKIDPIIAERSGHLILQSMIFIPFQNLNAFIQTFLISQKINKHFNLISIFSLILTFVFGYIFIIKYEMLEFGIIPTKFIQEIFCFILNIILVYQESNRECFAWPGFERVFEGMASFIHKISLSVISLFSEQACFEFNTYLAALLHSVDDLAIWEAYVNLGFPYFCISLAIANTIRTQIGHLIGQGFYKRAREEMIACFFYTFILFIILDILMLSFGKQIAILFIGREDLVDTLVTCIQIYTVFLYPTLMFYPFFTVFRLLGLDYYFLYMIVCLFPVVCVLINTSLVFVFHLKVPGLVLGLGLSISFMCVFFARKVFWLFDWELDMPENRSMLELELLPSQLSIHL